MWEIYHFISKLIRKPRYVSEKKNVMKREQRLFKLLLLSNYLRSSYLEIDIEHIVH